MPPLISLFALVPWKSLVVRAIVSRSERDKARWVPVDWYADSHTVTGHGYIPGRILVGCYKIAQGRLTAFVTEFLKIRTQGTTQTAFDVEAALVHLVWSHSDPSQRLIMLVPDIEVS